MGQNQSTEQEEPYHKRHYNLTNQQIQRQNSLSLSSPNLLLNREYARKRAATLQSNNSSSSLPQRAGMNRSNSISAGLGTSMNEVINGGGDTSAGNQSPILRLLPIENNVTYFDESDESDESEEEEGEEDYSEYEVYNPHSLNRGVTASPSFLDEDTLNVNSRLNRDNSYDNYPRERADFQRTKDEEREDLSYLSPVSGSTPPSQKTSSNHTITAQAFDHDHPRYFEGNNIQDEPGELKRYQLFDPPMSTNSHSSGDQDLSPTLRSGSLTLGSIREEDESLMGHSKNPSLAHVDYQDRETSTLHGLQPLQEANVYTANNGDAQPTTTKEFDLYNTVKSDLDKRIQLAVQNVEQNLQSRVQKLEEQTLSLGIKSANTSVDSRFEQEQELDSLDIQNYHSRGSQTLRKEMLSSASQKVEDLDSRVNQMEYMVSFKLNDIENKVQELNNGHSSMVRTMDDVDISRYEGQPTTRVGEIEKYRQLAGNHPDLIDKRDVVELRQELQTFGMRYHELNDGLLTDLMTQLREAKLLLLDNVDEVDKKLETRVDRIESEMHAKLLSNIENRIQERVRAMEQTSIRLERCFDKMEGRLGALETVLASRRPRPESMYQVMIHQQQQQQQRSLVENELRRSAFLDPNASPECPKPERREDSNMQEISPTLSSSTISRDYDSNSSSSIASSQSASIYRNQAMRPSKIVTNAHKFENWQSGPQSAGPARNVDRIITGLNLQTQGPMSASVAGQKRSIISIGVAGPKSAGFVATNNSKASAKAIRRPSSYKELLHYWKAGESTPDLLRNVS